MDIENICEIDRYDFDYDEVVHYKNKDGEWCQWEDVEKLVDLIKKIKYAIAENDNDCSFILDWIENTWVALKQTH